MELTIRYEQTSPVVEEFAERLIMLNLLYYASEAMEEMQFDSVEELQESIKRAMEICIAAHIPTRGNFLRVYKSYTEGLTYDWKLSELAYRLVCISGNPSNYNVAHEIISLIKNAHINTL